jgi:hypothetical protein
MADHLSQKQLLRYFDGELSQFTARSATNHLSRCEICALELGRLKQHLTAIAEAEVEIFEGLPPPPQPWPSLEPRLKGANRSRSGRSRKPFGLFETIWKMPLAYSGSALALLLIFLLIWGPVQPISAKEVIQRATAADSARLSIKQQEVVRQRVRITEKRRLDAEHTTWLDSWKSTKSAYWQTGSDQLNADLYHRYQENGLALELPLSPLALESWLRLAGCEPRASRDGRRIQVHVTSNAIGQARRLEELSFVVESRDWHVDEMKLSFNDVVFQIDEESSSILDRREVPIDVLARLEPPEPKPALPMHVASGHRSVTPSLNLDDLEMSVRYNLHQMGADLGDNIEITRAAGQLVVNASGVSAKRKDQLTARLANKPGIQLELQPTVNSGPIRQNPVRAVSPSVNRQQDPRLMGFFGSADAEENYTRGVLQASTEVLAHLYALRELSLRWPPVNDSDLSGPAKAQLAEIVRDHTHNIQTLVSDLKAQIDFLLKGFNHDAITEISSYGGTNWRDASATTLDSARTVDRILRSLLTTSETPMSVDEALPKLRQSGEKLVSGTNQLAATRYLK